MTNTGSCARLIFTLTVLLAPLASEALALSPQESAASPSVTWAEFVAAAEDEHGEAGLRAAEFLAKHRPKKDAALDRELLDDNLRLALEARERYPWAKSVTDELFLNDVLPYAVLDESRENWRSKLQPLVAPIVAECKTAGEAAQAINQHFFDVIEVHYNTGRKRPNASPAESIAQGRATCTGLTILFVDACRSVGIPARAAGVMRWHDNRGNHTWAEVWDGERWRFTGADEYDAAGFDRAWFVADAAKATAGDVEHAVWASSWKTTGHTFPLVWNRQDNSVASVDVTQRYVADAAEQEKALDAIGADGAALGEEAADRAMRDEWDALRGQLALDLAEEANAMSYRVGEHALRVKERVFGEEPEGGHSLWISMHGGGGAPAKVNDRQWDNQIKLYEPKEGIYVAPRAPTDTWNLWHEGHIDPLFDRMIASYVARRGVNPSRVYLMGYSAGGDGVFQLAPRMADRFAAAAMMAGHPNETKPDGLRNLPFLLFMGGEDGAYGRSEQAAKWRDWLADMQKGDADGYEHRVTIYPGKGHWMDGEDREALPWMAARTRSSWPKRIVWLQDDVVHDRFYWLSVDASEAAARQRVVADVTGQTIAITTSTEEADPAATLTQLSLNLHDRLIDLDRSVTVTWNGKEVWSGLPERSRATIAASLNATRDPYRAATAVVTVMRQQ